MDIYIRELEFCPVDLTAAVRVELFSTACSTLVTLAKSSRMACCTSSGTVAPRTTKLGRLDLHAYVLVFAEGSVQMRHMCRVCLG